MLGTTDVLITCSIGECLPPAVGSLAELSLGIYRSAGAFCWGVNQRSRCAKFMEELLRLGFKFEPDTSSDATEDDLDEAGTSDRFFSEDIHDVVILRDSEHYFTMYVELKNGNGLYVAGPIGKLGVVPRKQTKRAQLHLQPTTTNAPQRLDRRCGAFAVAPKPTSALWDLRPVHLAVGSPLMSHRSSAALFQCPGPRQLMDR